jgi:quercetin dioxygenase-like cupin family protein
MHTYPHKIENGEGEVITFLGVVRDGDGDRLQIEVFAPPNVGTPMHLHHLQDEAVTVVAGKLGLQFAGEPPRYAKAGETIILKRGVGHRWWNAGTTELRCTGWASPPNKLEYFLTALFASMRRSGGKRPGLFDAAFLVTRYRSEIRMLDIPVVVQKVAFPVLLVVGKLLGKYDKFKDAPEPVLEQGSTTRIAMSGAGPR